MSDTTLAAGGAGLGRAAERGPRRPRLADEPLAPLGARIRWMVGLVCLAGLTLACIFLHIKAIYYPELQYLGYGLILASLVIAWLRGGAMTYPFIVVMVVGYPPLAPFIIFDLLQLPMILPVSRWVQTPQYVAPAAVIAGLACLFLSVTVRSQPLAMFRPSRGERESRLADGSAMLTLKVSAALMAFLPIAIEPTLPIGFQTYHDISANRGALTNVAANLWIGSQGLLIASYYYVTRWGSQSEQRLANRLYVWALVFGVLWMLSHSRRVEIMGLLFLLFAIHGPNISRRLRWTLGVMAMTPIILIAYIRVNLSLLFLSHLPQGFVALPGGSGHLVLTYLAAIAHWYDEDKGLFLGRTYLGYIYNLPPGVLGLPRLASTQVHISSYTKIYGGSYWFNEPLINFGPMLIPVVVVAFTGLLNLSIRAVARYDGQAGGFVPFVFGTVFLAIIFRTLWYDLAPLIKGEFNAILLLGLATLVYRSYRQFSRRERG